MDRLIGEINMKRRHRNWNRRQRRKAAKETARQRYLTLRDEVTSINDPLTLEKTAERVTSDVLDTGTASLRRIGMYGSAERSDLAKLDENLSEEGHDRPSNSPGSSTTKLLTPQKNANLQLDTVRHQKLINGIQVRIRRLEKLQELRKRLVAKQCTGPDEAGGRKFTQSADDLIKRLSDLLADVDESDEITSIRRQRTRIASNCKLIEVKTKPRVRDIEAALFGGRRLHILLREDELIDVRRQWDAYENSEGQTVPVRWVEAPEKPTDEWAEYLVL